MRILNLLDATLEENELIPSPQLLQFLSSELKTNISHTFQTKQLPPPTQQAIDHLLSILASTSSLALPHLNTLLTDQGLIKLLLQLMYDESQEVLSNNAWFALKSRAMRLLANLSFENPIAQNQVRQYGGLPLIMNSCLFDQQNPYLREWSVLALRNLCLDNDENQRFVETLKAQGIPEDVQTEMNKLGISLRVGEDGKVKFTRHQKQ
uniref:Ataxin-10 domain-containing protein n=1 Tax=Arcella intermedia TaxID=1963864 RepID=A0A6B2LH11_9EUKA